MEGRAEGVQPGVAGPDRLYQRYGVTGNDLGREELTLCLPKNCVPELLLVLAYIDAFGTLGSRCRNGWGSIVLSGQNFRFLLFLVRSLLVLIFSGKDHF